jgi:uncharacterized protein (UPF0212 family)
MRCAKCGKPATRMVVADIGLTGIVLEWEFRCNEHKVWKVQGLE